MSGASDLVHTFLDLANLERVRIESQEAAMHARIEFAKELAEQVNSSAPRGETGKLSTACKIEVDDKEYHVWVYVDPEDAGFDPQHIEYGTVHNMAYPFWFPTIHGRRKEWPDRLAKALNPIFSRYGG